MILLDDVFRTSFDQRWPESRSTGTIDLGPARILGPRTLWIMHEFKAYLFYFLVTLLGIDLQVFNQRPETKIKQNKRIISSWASQNLGLSLVLATITRDSL